MRSASPNLDPAPTRRGSAPYRGKREWSSQFGPAARGCPVDPLPLAGGIRAPAGGDLAASRAFSVGVESLLRAEAVRPFPVEVKSAQGADSDRGMEVSELPCSTGERASSVEPVREIAVAESLVVTRPRRVKDDITGIRLWLEIEDVRTYRGPVNVRGIERAVRTRPAGVVRTLLVHLGVPLRGVADANGATATATANPKINPGPRWMVLPHYKLDAAATAAGEAPDRAVPVRMSLAHRRVDVTTAEGATAPAP
jgi:hypothetical protein